MTTTHRLAVNMNTETADALKQVIEKHSCSYTEAVRRTVAVYDFIAGELAAGRKVTVSDQDGANPVEVQLL